jgi:streptolysin S family bacteriocin protoxin
MEPRQAERIGNSGATLLDQPRASPGPEPQQLSPRHGWPLRRSLQPPNPNPSSPCRQEAEIMALFRPGLEHTSLSLLFRQITSLGKHAEVITSVEASPQTCVPPGSAICCVTRAACSISQSHGRGARRGIGAAILYYLLRQSNICRLVAPKTPCTPLPLGHQGFAFHYVQLTQYLLIVLAKPSRSERLKKQIPFITDSSYFEESCSDSRPLL